MSTCRRCGEIVFGASEHPCCVLNDVQPGGVCPSCQQSKVLNNEQARRRRSKHWIEKKRSAA